MYGSARRQVPPWQESHCCCSRACTAKATAPSPRFVNGNDAGILAGSSLDRPRWRCMAACIALLPAIMLLKVFATIASNSSGGVAGDFAPTVFAGAFAGFVFARCVSALFGVNFPWGFSVSTAPPVHLAGIIHAPLMAIFLAAEIVGTRLRLYSSAAMAIAHEPSGDAASNSHAATPAPTTTTRRGNLKPSTPPIPHVHNDQGHTNGPWQPVVRSR